jgi:cytochrome c-type biogenesis protein CcmH/NrfF
MLGMIGYLLLGQLLKPPSAVMKVMRALWIAPVVIFLVAQFLLPLARRRKQAAQTSSDNETTKDNDDNSATHSI